VGRGGLDYQHQKLRRYLLPRAYGQPCPLCWGRPWQYGDGLMWPWQKLDLDHAVPRALGGQGPRRIVHARCNRRAGAILGNRLRGQRRAALRLSSRVSDGRQ
jgi:hypothetical protein